MAIKQISVFLQNEKGSVAGALDCLAKNNIEIRALSIADTADFGILRIITDNSENTLNALSKCGYICKETLVVAAYIEDKAGGLSKVVNILKDENIDVDYLYAFVTKTNNKACVVLRVNSTEQAEKMLEKSGVSYILNGSAVDL